jgi:hypothetical protein
MASIIRDQRVRDRVSVDESGGVVQCAGDARRVVSWLERVAGTVLARGSAAGANVLSTITTHFRASCRARSQARLLSRCLLCLRVPCLRLSTRPSMSA